MIQVLFVCTGNICRSPMAEGLLKYLMPERRKKDMRISSAGTYAIYGNPATDHAVEVMKKEGIDISMHRAQVLTKEMIVESKLVLTMEPYHLKIVKSSIIFGRKKCHLVSDFHPDATVKAIEDPYQKPLGEYIRCKDTIKVCMERIIDHIETLF